MFGIGCCTTIAPPEDFPEIPLPGGTILVSVSGERREGGVFLSDEEYQKALSNVKSLAEERNLLRKVIEEYNRWAGRGE